MGSHTVWHLTILPHTHQCLFFHTPPLRPNMIDHFHSCREGNSFDRQARLLLSDSNLIQNDLRNQYIETIQDKHCGLELYMENSRRKWRNWALSLSLSLCDRSMKVRSKNTSSVPPTAHSCHAWSCDLHTLPVYGSALQFPGWSLGKGIPQEMKEHSVDSFPSWLILVQLTGAVVYSPLLTEFILYMCIYAYHISIRWHVITLSYIVGKSFKVRVS